MRRLDGPAAVAERYDLAVIGAGPAGMAAAVAAARAGLSVLTIDEGQGPGGQIWRAITAPPLARRAVLGADYWRGEAPAAEFLAAAGDYLPGASVWLLDAGRRIGLSAGGAARLIAAERVIMATGALERPVPVPGWTLPGVLGAGGAQTLLKSAGLAPEGAVLAGAGPLLWLLARQLIEAGAPPLALLDVTDGARRRAALAHLPGFLASPYLRKGLGLIASVYRAVPVYGGVSGIEILGETQADAVRFRHRGGVHTLRTAHVLLHAGVTPNLNLAAAARCALAWDAAQACFRPVTDAWGETSLPGIAVAGDGAGIAGAEAAAARGTLAGLAAAHALGRLGAAARDQAAAAPRAVLSRHARGRAFLDALYRPADAFLAPADAVTVCRCEEVTAGQVRAAAALGATGPNQAKAFLRCGMGPCQGRMCGLTVTALIAAARGQTPEATGYYRLRPPVKPLTLGELAALPADDAAQQAVARG